MGTERECVTAAAGVEGNRLESDNPGYVIRETKCRR